MAVLHDLRRPLLPAPDDFLDIETTSKVLEIPVDKVVNLIMKGIVTGCQIPFLNDGDWIVTAASVLFWLNYQKGHRPGRRLSYLPALNRKPWGRFGLLSRPSPEYQRGLCKGNVRDDDPKS